MASDDEVRTRLRVRTEALWPVLVAMGTWMATAFLAARLLPPAWRDVAPFVLATAVAAAAWAGVERVRRAKVEDVVLHPDGVRIGSRALSFEEGRKALSTGLPDDPNLAATIDACIARRKAKRGALPIRDLHAVVTYQRGEGLRGPLETAAWAMVDQGAKRGAGGPEIRLWLDADGVARGAGG